MESKKRVYVGLLAISLMILTLLVILAWYIIQNRELIISKILFLSLGSLMAILFIIMGTGIISIIMMLTKAGRISYMDKIARMSNSILFPFVMLFGRMMGIRKEKILQSYIAVNNKLVKSKKMLLPGKEVMILLPHCLQNAACPHKITININNCKQCGGCCIGDIIQISDRYNAVVKVASGGTQARKHIKDYRPQAVIAVACERDLSSGIQDSTLPVLGVMNSRPNGPCYNTCVDIGEIEKALDLFCKGGV